MADSPLRILHVSAEVQPLMKTGGLADVAGALPAALHRLGHDTRVLMPGYGAALERLQALGPIREHALMGSARLVEGHLPGGCPVWLLDTPSLRARGENPYVDARGRPWPDNAECFNALATTAVALAQGDAGIDWQADVLHAHDWHAGLVPVHAMLRRVPAATLFTIHNLAYQGRFPLTMLDELGLPGWLAHWQALEHDGLMSFIKGGIAFADRVTTVSRTYAEEIRTPGFGEGLDGLLRHRGDDLSGITNGIDTEVWNPKTDPALARNFDAQRPAGKRDCRAALLGEAGLVAEKDMPIIAWVGRLTRDKGADLLLRTLPELVALPAVVVILGSGDRALEQSVAAAARARKSKVRFYRGFDESLAHRVFAGADMLLMPSRHEPCGLAQLNAMRYGTVPVVHATGGLAETVTDFDAAAETGEEPTGYHFHEDKPAALLAAARRAVDCFRKPRSWRRLVVAGMRRDSSWDASARAYIDLYREIASPRP